MSTFLKFPDLPKELRDMIWSFVIRDDNPGVHIFGYFDDKKKDMTESRRLISCGQKSWTYAALPWRHYFDSLDENRSDENVSTYLIDGGLWTACKESRLIMEKHFRQSEWPKAQECDQYYGGLTKENFKMPATGYFQGGELHCLTVFPHRDLFVLQMDDIARGGWWTSGLNSPLGKNLRGCQGVRHLAIEYRPEWFEGSYYMWHHIKHTLMDAIFDIGHSLCKLWFIDHTLKRSENAPAFKEITDNSWDMNAFYAADRKFLEVDTFDYLKIKTDWQYAKPVWDKSDRNISSSRQFVSSLEYMIDEREEVDDPDATEIELEDYCFIGLLGWGDL
ncbi:2EXR domain-containing protein [Fusarium acuminatum]|uniref:2EXR domain-containing protein n=1 Tax=Fusarium acuminatum TaxID=5515 RepID=A0ABZ2XA61_9HYPO